MAKRKKSKSGDCSLPDDMKSVSKCNKKYSAAEIKKLAAKCGIQYIKKQQACEELLKMGKLPSKKSKKSPRKKSVSPKKKSKKSPKKRSKRSPKKRSVSPKKKSKKSPRKKSVSPKKASGKCSPNFKNKTACNKESAAKLKKLAEKCGIQYINKKQACEDLLKIGVNIKAQSSPKKSKKSSKRSPRKKSVSPKKRSVSPKKASGKCSPNFKNKTACNKESAAKLKKLAEKCGIQYINKKQACEELLKIGVSVSLSKSKKSSKRSPRKKSVSLSKKTVSSDRGKELKKLKVKDLKELSKKYNLSYSNKRKDDLIAQIILYEKTYNDDNEDSEVEDSEVEIEEEDETDPNKQYELAVEYADNSEHAKALYWLKKAAVQGHVRAQHDLGLQYKEEKKYKEAIKWLKKAANQGSKESARILAEIHSQKGVIPDQKEFDKWYDMAEESDEEESDDKSDDESEEEEKIEPSLVSKALNTLNGIKEKIKLYFKKGNNALDKKMQELKNNPSSVNISDIQSTSQKILEKIQGPYEIYNRFISKFNELLQNERVKKLSESISLYYNVQMEKIQKKIEKLRQNIRESKEDVQSDSDDDMDDMLRQMNDMDSEDSDNEDISSFEEKIDKVDHDDTKSLDSELKQVDGRSCGKYNYNDLVNKRLDDLKDILRKEGLSADEVDSTSDAIDYICSSQQYGTCDEQNKYKCGKNSVCEIMDAKRGKGVCISKEKSRPAELMYEGTRIVGNKNVINILKKKLFGSRDAEVKTSYNIRSNDRVIGLPSEKDAKKYTKTQLAALILQQENKKVKPRFTSEKYLTKKYNKNELINLLYRPSEDSSPVKIKPSSIQIEEVKEVISPPSSDDEGEEYKVEENDDEVREEISEEDIANTLEEISSDNQKKLEKNKDINMQVLKCIGLLN